MKDRMEKKEKPEYLSQINRFYNNSLPSNREIVVLQYTPEYLIQLGAKQLPIIMKQSTLNKCIRPPKGSRSAHNLSRYIRVDQEGNNLLIALQLNNILYGKEINEIKSIYGKKFLVEYLTKHK